MAEWAGLLTALAAVWGIIFTVNSAVTAFLQTKWMRDQRKLLMQIATGLDSVVAYVGILVGDDLKKIDSSVYEEGSAGLDEPPVRKAPTASKGHARSRKCGTCGYPKAICEC